MAEAFLIMLREGFEATLIVGIVFAYLGRIGRTDMTRPVWLGVVAGVAVATAIGLIVHWTTGSLSGDARLVSFAIIALVAVVVLTWMIFWMARQARAIKGDLEHRIDSVLDRGANVTGGVVFVAFAAVLREGIEAALFLVAASTAADGTAVVIGSLLGLAVAAALGYAVYVGGRMFPMRTFFRITGVILIVFAAGLVAKAVFWLQAAGIVGTVNDAVYNLTSIEPLTVHSQVGRFLAGLFGWDPRPSVEQVLAWLLYFVPVVVWFLWGDRFRSSRSAPSKPTPAVAS